MALDLLTPHLIDYANPVNRQAPLNRGLLSWWRVLPQTAGGERLRDLMGRYPGTLMTLQPSSATVGWGPTSRRGGHGEIRCGTAGFLQMAVVSQMQNAPAFSFSIWAKQPAIGPQTGLLCMGASGSSSILVEPFSDGRAYTEINNAGSTYGSFLYSSLVTTGQWFHLTSVYNGTGGTNAAKLQMYLNGRAQTLTFVGTLPATTPALAGQVLQLGNYPISGNHPWNGSFDDARLYTRALTASEVSHLYQVSLRGYPTELNRRTPLWIVPMAFAVFTGVYVLAADLGTLALVGTATTPDIILPADPASSALTGTATTPRLSLTATSSPLSLAGQATIPRLALAATPGVSTMAGTATTPRLALLATSGALAVTGTATMPRLFATSGALSVGGTATTPRVSLTATPGSSAVAGTANPLRLTLAATSGALAVTGTATMPRLAATTGSLSVVGSLTPLRLSLSTASATVGLQGTATPLRLMLASVSGTQTLAGTAIGLRGTHRLLAVTEAVEVLGSEAILRRTGQDVIIAGSGSLEVDGVVVLRHLASVVTAAGALTVTGTAGHAALTMLGASGSLASTGAPTLLELFLAAAAGSALLTGADVVLRVRHHYFLTAEPGDLALDGTAVAAPPPPPSGITVVEYLDHTEVYSPSGKLLRSIRKHHLSYWQTYQRVIKR